MQPVSFPKSTKTWMVSVHTRFNHLAVPMNLPNFTHVWKSWKRHIDAIQTKRPRHLLWSLTRRRPSFQIRNVSKKRWCASVTKRVTANSWTCICCLINTSIWRTSRFAFSVDFGLIIFVCLENWLHSLFGNFWSALWDSAWDNQKNRRLQRVCQQCPELHNWFYQTCQAIDQHRSDCKASRWCNLLNFKRKLICSNFRNLKQNGLMARFLVGTKRNLPVHWPILVLHWIWVTLKTLISWKLLEPIVSSPLFWLLDWNAEGEYWNGLIVLNFWFRTPRQRAERLFATKTISEEELAKLKKPEKNGEAQKEEKRNYNLAKMEHQLYK